MIDVSDLLLDGDLTDIFTVIRRQQVVDQWGEATVTVSTIDNVLGVVTPSAASDVVIEDAYQTQAKTLNVVTRFRLRGATQDTLGNQYQPDEIVWNLDTYQVKLVQDYTGWGGGFVSADCASTDLLDEPDAYAPAAPVLRPAP